MIQAAIEALLQHTIGLNATTIGSQTIARAVHQRMAACGITDMAMYLARLQTVRQELAELIEQVTVLETWFFRDQEPFAYLSQYVRSVWLPAQCGSALRVLSVACATGEEPYSVAMALLEAGVAPQQAHIDAVDISAKGLRTAQRGVYRAHSFRGVDPALRARYFEPEEGGYRLCTTVSGMVQFRQGNILEQAFLAQEEPYEVVFCRNLLMYFAPPARSRALQVLERLLKERGLLFVGYAETSLPPAARFAAVPHPRAFAFRKEERVDRQRMPRQPAYDGSGSLSPREGLRPAPTQSRQRAGGEGRCAPCAHTVAPKGPGAGVQDPGDPHPNPLPRGEGKEGSGQNQYDNALDTARQLADQGRLAEAAARCESHLRAYGPRAQTYHLLGLIRQAAGDNTEAERCFNRAVYLEPYHYDALIHLALLVEHRGDAAVAAVLRQRTKRCQPDAR